MQRTRRKWMPNLGGSLLTPKEVMGLIGVLSLSLLCGVLLSPALGNQNAAPNQICLNCFDFSVQNGAEVARTWVDSVVHYRLLGDRAPVAASEIRNMLAEMTKRTSVSFVEADQGANFQLLLVVDATSFAKVEANDPGLLLPANSSIKELLRKMVGMAEKGSQDCAAVHVGDKANTFGGFIISNGNDPSCMKRYFKGIMGLSAFADSDADDLRNLCFLYTARWAGIRSRSALENFLASNPNICPSPLSS